MQCGSKVSICNLDCNHTQLVGDGYCNYETNTIPCAFDGGDCCLSCTSKAFCNNTGDNCDCLTNDASQETKETSYTLIGDGNCHDELNSATCNFDGGDCCGSVEIEPFCSNCNCSFKEICDIYSGDGICQDLTNNEECDYDHGDCCLTNLPSVEGIR